MKTNDMEIEKQRNALPAVEVQPGKRVSVLNPVTHDKMNDWVDVTCSKCGSERLTIRKSWNPEHICADCIPDSEREKETITCPRCKGDSRTIGCWSCGGTGSVNKY